jgi:hypothetical protein
LVCILESGEMNYDLATLLFFVSTAVFLLGLVALIRRVMLERAEVAEFRKKEKDALMQRLQETLQYESTRYFG